MSERPVLTLKRRPAAETAASEASGNTVPVMRRRRTVVVVTPDPRKQKKQAKKDAEKAAEAARKAAAKEERRRQWLLKNARPPKPVKAPVRPPRPVRLIPVADALRVLAEYWPPLFNPELPLRLMKTGIREEMEADIVARQLPVSAKQLRRCLRSLTRSEGYLNATLSGSIRYGLNGQPAGVVTEEEYRLSRLRLEKVLKRRE
ncbi:TPA: conjugal transfer protein [Salmonella enterica]|uniref:ProQ/FINO family protein n=1 Tax=Salmonella enterica TaxID=28901 RepID=UPI0009ADBDF7|nr:ProQ/FINO family protein [Salmonella enterica]EDE2461872.1 conjugal transfer protein [Salmonella enterica subsp. enterica serovar Pensacola]EDV7203533.1 conjugal transfer protein [Salmonella enterica subsp. enterica serovar Bredeney]EDX9716493.1 conjugal transfer protein [Salmonella enterica subsp. salamae]EDQ1421321.1 conjugal transfer protein [Salmonella enterica]EGU9002816.1 conjugal transfer protein [Salmonella enterica]